MTRPGLVVLGLLCGCVARNAPVTESDASRADASSADASNIAPVLRDPCPGTGDPPPTLECTGLYVDLAAKQITDAVRSFAPAVPLWSDGAEKTRWVYLPPGTKIDVSSRSEWVFPVGTRFWKEFRVGGKRIETRLFQKVTSTFWVHAAYAWNSDESATVATSGEDVPLDDGGTWHIPLTSECDNCHNGRIEHVLGFEQGLLGLPGAVGITLGQLVAEGRLSRAVSQVDLRIGDDGTGVAAPVLGWLHVNCGVTCHNNNGSALGYAAGMNLRLDPTLLDGRSSADFDSILTTVDVIAGAPAWHGATRIVRGDPASSLLVQLISHRGIGQQMPPIASNVVDEANVANVVAWVTRMGLQQGLVVDTGAFDAAVGDSTVADAPFDAGPLDDGVGVDTLE